MQINFQVPFGLSSTARLVVSTPFGDSEPTPVRRAYDVPGLFTRDSSGCGLAAVLNVAPDGSVEPNSQARSASPGEYISIFATGFGPVFSPPPDGEPTGGNPPTLLYVPGATVGDGSKARSGFVTFRGLAPGWAGVDQLNAQLPPDAPEGCEVPLRLHGAVGASQLATVSIRKGGGACADAATAAMGRLTWSRIETTGPEPGRQSEEERLEAKFSRGGAGWLDHAASPRVGVWIGARDPLPAPQCGGAGGANTEAGTLTLFSGGSPGIALPPVRTPRGEYRYRSILNSGTVRPGQAIVRGNGSADIGTFESSVSIPPPIRILNDFRPGTLIDSSKPLVIAWTNGRPGDLVNVRLLSIVPYGDNDRTYSGLEYFAPAESGSVTLDPVQTVPGQPSLPINPGIGFRVVIRLIAAAPANFAATGLSLGGRHNWEYEHRFLGLRLGTPAN